jgi:signal transduction histidine kinase
VNQTSEGGSLTTLSQTTGSLGTRPELRSMLAVSRAVARGGPLSEVLDMVAAEAAGVVSGADRSSIILIEGRQHRFRLAGSCGLSEGYRLLLSTGEAKLLPGEGPSGVAFSTGAPVVIDDLDADPRVATWAWRDIARDEGYGAIVSLPLIVDETVVGTLNVYRTEPGPWPPDHVEVLAFFAEHAAGAVRTAQLLDQRDQQLTALERVVRALREQTHEHANRLHAVSGLLALGEVREAKEFLHVLETAHLSIRRTIDACIHVPTVAGVVLAEAIVAGQRGIRLTVDDASQLTRLPGALSDMQAVTLLGNLLDNAFDAVAEMPVERREVTLRIDEEPDATVFSVCDRGPGLPSNTPTIFAGGVTTKDGHEGIGLSLVRETVAAAMGTIDADCLDGITTFRVSIPT